jgi:hypothetical protein
MRGTAIINGGSISTTQQLVPVVNRNGAQALATGMTIRNEGSGGALLVSLGGPFVSILANAELVFDGHFTTYTIKAASGTVAWSAVLSVL